QKESFLQYSSEVGESADIEKIEEAWKNKFVFYSPKIVYGVDFNPKQPIDVFVLSTGNSINSLQIAQQMTRCRNIKTISFFFNNVYRELKYESVADVKEFYTNFTSLFEKELKDYGMIALD